MRAREPGRAIAGVAIACALAGCAVAPPTWTKEQSALFEEFGADTAALMTIPGVLEWRLHGAALCRPREAGGGCIWLAASSPYQWERISERFGDMVVVHGRVFDEGLELTVDKYYRYAMVVDEIGPWRGP